jgi:WXG100 family type VII secretion target
MAQDGTHVDTSIMRQGAKTINETGVGITNVNSQVDNTMQELLGTWRSDAATVFQEAMGQFDQTVKMIVQKLQTLAENVETSAREYDSGDEQNLAFSRQTSGTIKGLTGF